MKWILLSSNQSINSVGIHRLLPISFGPIYSIFTSTFFLKIFEKELNAVWNASSCGDLSPPWTTLIRMKADRLAGLRFIDSIKSFILTSESCFEFTGRIFDRVVVDWSISTLLIFKLTNKIFADRGRVLLWNDFLKKWPVTAGQFIWAGVSRVLEGSCPASDL